MLALLFPCPCSEKQNDLFSYTSETSNGTLVKVKLNSACDNDLSHAAVSYLSLQTNVITVVDSVIASNLEEKVVK